MLGVELVIGLVIGFLAGFLVLAMIIILYIVKHADDIKLLVHVLEEHKKMLLAKR